MKFITKSQKIYQCHDGLFFVTTEQSWLIDLSLLIALIMFLVAVFYQKFII